MNSDFFFKAGGVLASYVMSRKKAREGRVDVSSKRGGRIELLIFNTKHKLTSHPLE